MQMKVGFSSNNILTAFTNLCPPDRERHSCWGSRNVVRAALFSLITILWRVRMRGVMMPTGRSVILSLVLNRGTVVTLPQTL